MTTPRPVRVTVTHRFEANAEDVFDAWTDPDIVSKWMLAAPVQDEDVVRISVDARAGGRFSFVVRREGLELDHQGQYLEIDRPRRLVFTWGVNEDPGETSVVTVEIAPSLDGGCELTLTHEMIDKWADYAERTRQGWGHIIAAIAQTIERAGAR
ncbi:MAG TPA: SRPBCC family protein [Dehalococcoidia bacterium]|nr:SRPBCC family protein [Dehalococcoidia bacterium]